MSEKRTGEYTARGIPTYDFHLYGETASPRVDEKKTREDFLEVMKRHNVRRVDAYLN